MAGEKRKTTRELHERRAMRCEGGGVGCAGRLIHSYWEGHVWFTRWENVLSVVRRVHVVSCVARVVLRVETSR